jgi:hypothetical protein
MIIVTPNASQPVVNPDGTMSEPFRAWVQQITGLQMLTGSGSPEGVVSAPVTTQYMDTAGTAGSILYIKKLADIGADPKKGWILV